MRFNIVLCTIWFLHVYAVKDYLFKKCSENGFCERNRYYSSSIGELGRNYQPRYSIDPRSITITEDHKLNAIVFKELRDGSYISLKLDLSVIGDYDLRFQLDEVNRNISESIKVNHQRYDGAASWVLQSNLENKLFEYQLLHDVIILNYGKNHEYSATISLYPIKITIFYHGIPHMILNDRNFLNIEHYRTKESEADFESNDVLPEESRYGAYKDDFADSADDTLPLGPESVAVDVTFVNCTYVYGIPEHADSFSLKDTTGSDPYRLFNVDIFEYETQSKHPMYGSIPFMIGANANFSAGILWINAADSYVDIKKNKFHNHEKLVDTSIDNVQTHWMSENGIIDVILMVKPSARDINKSYGILTGNPMLPNLFSLGYHQCRWNYNDELDVLGIHSSFDGFDIPYDTLWLDIEYTDEKRYFTWNNNQFPNPDSMMSEMGKTGRNLVVIVDPHMKTEYHISESIINKGIGIKNPDCESTYFGHCWPGESIWIDTLNPESENFLTEQYSNGTQLLGNSVNGHLWNDMNEPSVFNGPETTAPKDLVHYGNWEHRSIHNLYGLTFHEATYKALIKRNPNQRPFLLTRAFFPGSQRTAAMWTGDNMARWEYLKESIPMVLTMNVMGFPFAGADVGGFFGNPNGELLTRWYQAGIWYPFFRGHAHIDSARREPWVAGGEHSDIMREALKLRYRFLPLFYTEFWKSSETGSPIITPLVWNVPNDINVYDIDDEFYLGGLLIKPVTTEGAKTIDVYFPCDNSTYYDFFNLEIKYDSCAKATIDIQLKDIPIFIKSGTILSTKDRSRRSSKLMKYDPYTLYVVFDVDGKASGDLYIDDGESFGYLKEDWIHVQFEADDNNKTIKGKITHTYDSDFVNSLHRVKINKIVVTGSKQQLSASASIDDISNQADIVLNSNDTFTIRNPQLHINKEWIIKY